LHKLYIIDIVKLARVSKQTLLSTHILSWNWSQRVNWKVYNRLCLLCSRRLYLSTLLVITSVIDSSMALILFTLHCSYVESLANNRKLNSRNNNNNNMAILPNDQSGFQNHFCSTQKWFLVDLMEAYESAKKWKKSKEIDLFDMEFEKNIWKLSQELIHQSYTPWIYKAFIIFDPVCREIFAAPFRDRIVHHLIYGYIANTMDKKMYYHSYWARKYKWIHLGINKAQSFIRSCHAIHKQSSILKIDIIFHIIKFSILSFVRWTTILDLSASNSSWS